MCSSRWTFGLMVLKLVCHLKSPGKLCKMEIPPLKKTFQIRSTGQSNAPGEFKGLQRECSSLRRQVSAFASLGALSWRPPALQGEPKLKGGLEWAPGICILTNSQWFGCRQPENSVRKNPASDCGASIHFKSFLREIPMVYKYLTSWAGRTLHGNLSPNIQILPKQTLVSCIHTRELTKERKKRSGIGLALNITSNSEILLHFLLVEWPWAGRGFILSIYLNHLCWKIGSSYAWDLHVVMVG